MQINVQFRPLHAPLFEQERATIVHAHLPAKFVEATILAALSEAQRLLTGDVIVFVSQLPKAKLLLRRVLHRPVTIPYKTSSIDAIGYDLGFRTLWVISGDSPITNELPTKTPSDVFVAEAHERLTEPPVTGERRNVVCGEMPPPGHWLLKADYHKVNATAIVAEFPEAAAELLPADDPWYLRNMELENVTPDLAGDSVLSYAAERLFVRSDKPLAVLTERQRKSAIAQPGVHRIIPFEPNALQHYYVERKKQLLEEKGGKPWYILVKYRRGGFTTLEQAVSYRTCDSFPWSQCVTLADTWGKSKSIFEMVHLFHDRDPRAQRLQAESKTELVFSNGSKFIVGTAGATAFARGEGNSRFHGSEVAFWCRGNNDQKRSLWSGITAATQYGDITLESTPNGREWFCQQYFEAKHGQSELKAIFVPWFIDPMNQHAPSQFVEEEIRDTLTAEERELQEQHDLTLAQISFRREVRRTHGVLADQEYPENDDDCFLTSGLLFFDKSKIRYLTHKISAEIQPDRADIPGGYEITWRRPEKGKKYVIGADSSEGIPGCDPNGLVVLNAETLEQCARVYGYFTPEQLGTLVKKFSVIYNGAMYAVERNNHGHAVLLQLKHLNYDMPHFRGGPCFYYHQGDSIKTSRAGWDTNTASRQVLLSQLNQWLMDYDEDKIHDPLMVNEMTTFRLQDNGKWEHDDDAHDDTIFMWGIALQAAYRKLPEPSISVL